MTVNEFLRRERDFFSSVAVHLHSVSAYAGSPRTNPKHSKHPWIKLGAARGSLVDRDIFWKIVQVGVCARFRGSWIDERLISHQC